MLQYRGHIFDGPMCTCCTGDAKVVKLDPTGTASLRRHFTATLAIRWRSLRPLIKQVLIDQDLLGLSNKGLMMQAATPAVIMGGNKVQSFQRWFDFMLDRMVMIDGGVSLSPFVSNAYRDGVKYANDLLASGMPILPPHASDRVGTIAQLAVVELQGIMQAVSQQATRVVANGVLHNRRPMHIVRDVWRAIDKVGTTRSQTLVEFIVVKAFGEGTLDVFASTGIEQVGLVPEGFARDALRDAKRKRRTTKSKAVRPNQGPGSRISRTQTPSRSTIQRIRRAQTKLEKLGQVYVRTAGDKKVCPTCEGIAEEGPYSINTARSLIPAHPRCRCVFVPANDKRFARDVSHQ